MKSYKAKPTQCSSVTTHRDPLTAHIEIHYAVTEYAKYFMYENKNEWKELVTGPRQKEYFLEF